MIQASSIQSGQLCRPPSWTALTTATMVHCGDNVHYRDICAGLNGMVKPLEGQGCRSGMGLPAKRSTVTSSPNENGPRIATPSMAILFALIYV